MNTVDVGLFVKKHTQMLAILIWKQNAQKRTKNPPKPCTQCQHCHLSLPPFRAALVPLWAMAPRFVQEAFSPDFQFPPQLLKCEFWSVLVRPNRSCQVQFREAPHSGPESSHRRFISTLLSTQRRGTHIRSLQSRALQTNVIPVIWLRRRWVTRAYLLKVVILLETAQTHTQSKRVLSGKRVGLLGILVWQAGEKSAESNTDPSSFNEAVRESNAT